MTVLAVDGDFMPTERVQLGQFVLDMSRYELTRDGAPVRLERIPMDLLILLVRGEGKLIGREEIIERLWGKDVYFDTDNSINTAVRKIRRALADDADEPQYLQTVVGRGYRFVAPTAQEDASGQASPEGLTVSAEELGRAIMTAAGLDPENPRGTPKPRDEE